MKVVGKDHSIHIMGNEIVEVGISDSRTAGYLHRLRKLSLTALENHRQIRPY